MNGNLIMLTVDTGLSGSKIVKRTTPSSPELLLMNPEVAEVTRETIDFYKSRRMTSPKPENEAWVEYEGTLYAVGFLAQKHFNARVVMSDPKYEWAIAKVLAAVGVMALSEGLPDEFDLALAIPLPFGEWEARHRFHRDLQKALFSFSFCDKLMCVNLKVFICVPEGGGHAMSRGEKIGSDAFNKQKILSLMWGYRDISPVLFDRGVISGHTEPIGFFRLIDLMQNRTFGYASREREQVLLETIHRVGKDIKTKNLKHLALSRHPERKAEEVEQITEALKASRGEYWAMVERFLRGSIASEVNEIIVGGGAADYFKPELRQFLAQNYSHANICWSADLEEDVRLAFNLVPAAGVLCSRLTDVYGLSNFLRSQIYPHSSVISIKR